MSVQHDSSSAGPPLELSRDESDTAVAELVPALAQLVALAREQHVTRAATALGLAQPTLSRSLARWEALLGLALVVRTGRGVRLTPAGTRVAEAATEALALLTRAVRVGREEAGLQGGRLTFAFLHTMGPDVVPRLLEELLRRYPGVHVDLQQDAHATMLTALRRGEVDLVLTAPAPADRTGLTVDVLDTQPLVLTLPLGHRLAHRARLRLAELGGEPWVVLAPRYGMRTITDALWAGAGIAPAVAFEGQDASTLRGLVSVGLGVAVLPEEPGAARVAQVPLDPPAHREIALVRATGRGPSPVVTAFRDVAVEFTGRLLPAPGPSEHVGPRAVADRRDPAGVAGGAGASWTRP